LVQRNVTAVCNKNRSVFLAGRTRFNKHPRQSLDLHVSYICKNLKEKESHQQIVRSVLRHQDNIRYKSTLCIFVQRGAAWFTQRTLLQAALQTCAGFELRNNGN
jgi:hypothetical protein